MSRTFANDSIQWFKVKIAAVAAGVARSYGSTEAATGTIPASSASAYMVPRPRSTGSGSPPAKRSFTPARMIATAGLASTTSRLKRPRISAAVCPSTPRFRTFHSGWRRIIQKAYWLSGSPAPCGRGFERRAETGRARRRRVTDADDREGSGGHAARHINDPGKGLWGRLALFRLDSKEVRLRDEAERRRHVRAGLRARVEGAPSARLAQLVHVRGRNRLRPREIGLVDEQHGRRRARHALDGRGPIEEAPEAFGPRAVAHVQDGLAVREKRVLQEFAESERPHDVPHARADLDRRARVAWIVDAELAGRDLRAQGRHILVVERVRHEPPDEARLAHARVARQGDLQRQADARAFRDRGAGGRHRLGSGGADDKGLLVAIIEATFRGQGKSADADGRSGTRSEGTRRAARRGPRVRPADRPSAGARRPTLPRSPRGTRRSAGPSRAAPGPRRRARGTRRRPSRSPPRARRPSGSSAPRERRSRRRNRGRTARRR